MCICVMLANRQHCRRFIWRSSAVPAVRYIFSSRYGQKNHGIPPHRQAVPLGSNTNTIQSK